MKLYPNITLYFSIWILTILLVSFIGFLKFPHSGKFSEDFLKSFSNWDGGHFLGIAEYGYREKFQYAFFPLYPLAISAFNKITGDYLVAALIVSVVASFLGLQLLYKLIAVDLDKKIAQKAILIALSFPTSFYFLTAYSEGLFFFLVVASFYCFRKGNFFWVAFFACLASATRLTGLALAGGLLVEVYTTSGINRRNWFLLLSPAGFLIYCFYLYSQTGDPFYFLTAQSNWQRTLSVPVVNLWEGLKNINENLVDLIFAIFGLGLALRAFRFLPISFSIFGLISVLLPLFTSQLSSMPRYLLPIFPIFILIALIKNQYMAFFYQLASIMLLSVFVALFVNGYWVS